MNRSVNAQKRALKKGLSWAFWLTNLAIIIGFWWNGSGQGLTVEPLLAVARLAGLIATFCALTQFVLMGRVGWLEPIFGLDKLAIFHRRNGIATIMLILVHSFLMTLGYSQLTGLSAVAQIQQFILFFPFLPLAIVAEMLFVLIVASSIYIARKHLKFETWYYVHVLTYLAIVLVFWHQFANGADLLGNQLFRNYWIGLYLFVLLNLIVWRFSIPLIRSSYHGFRVKKVVTETPSATSLYITGRKLDRFTAKGGQFVLIRILAKGLWWQEHPFSLSMIPKTEHFRLTIRQLGDFTNQIPHLKKGTPVIVSGPYGAFTHQLQLTRKAVYIAGGIGITPIRSLLEERASWSKKGDAVLLYGNRSQKETVLWQEIIELATRIGMPVFNVLSDQPDYKGEKGYIDREKIARLVPDIARCDVFVCGPPPMVNGIMPALKELGVPKKYVHYERFSLHKQ